MKKISSILFVLLFTMNTYAQCEPEITKIMVLGDSWAFFSWQDDSYNENLDKFGFTDIRAKSNGDISVNGTRASNYFNDVSRRNAVKQFLLQNKDIEYVHFSLGGNDFLGEWNKNMDSIQEFNLMKTILLDIQNGIDSINKYKPGLKILFAGYDYPNFAETVGTLSPPALQQLHPFYNLWNDMGQPTPLEINTLVKKITQTFEDSIATLPNVSFVNNIGLMQWHYGQTSNLTVAPFGSYLPNSVNLPYGDINYPSPLDALNFNGLDAFHLNNAAYNIFIERHFEKYYWQELRNADTTFVSQDVLKNGVLNTNSSIPDSLLIGTVNNQLTKSIITFYTSYSNYITKASIFIQKENSIGNNLHNEDLNVGIKKGFYGSSENIENDDYSFVSDYEETVCTYGSLESNKHWLRIDLTADHIKYINKNGMTQFRLFYDITDQNRNISFKNENIYLDLTYGEEPINGISQTTVQVLDIYPNPTNNILHIANVAKNTRLILYDFNGRLLNKYDSVSAINVENLVSGIYFITVTSLNKSVKYKFIKE